MDKAAEEKRDNNRESQQQSETHQQSSSDSDVTAPKHHIVFESDYSPERTSAAAPQRGRVGRPIKRRGRGGRPRKRSVIPSPGNGRRTYIRIKWQSSSPSPPPFECVFLSEHTSAAGPPRRRVGRPLKRRGGLGRPRKRSVIQSPALCSTMNEDMVGAPTYAPPVSH